MKKYIAPSAAAILVLGLALYFGADRVSESQPISEIRPEDPCVGKSDEECMALIDALRAEGERKHAQLIEDANDSGLDLRTLPKIPGHVDYFTEPHSDLATAVREADLIVVATSEHIRLVPFVSAKVTLGVERTLKGTAPSEMTIIQNVTLQPEVDDSGRWQPISLAVDELAPLLFPGDRAVLFLERLDKVGYRVQPYTGYYLIDKANRLLPLPSNPFASMADGKPLDQFLAAVTQALAQPAAP